MSWIVPTARPSGLQNLQVFVSLRIDSPDFSKTMIESGSKAEPARRRRGGLLIESAGRTPVFGASIRSTGGGGPTDTDSAANLGRDVICVYLRYLR